METTFGFIWIHEGNTKIFHDITIFNNRSNFLAKLAVRLRMHEMGQAVGEFHSELYQEIDA